MAQTEKKEDGGGEVTERVITVAEAAINHLKDLKSKQGVDHLFLRMGVRSGGCSGMSYVSTRHFLAARSWFPILIHPFLIPE